MAGPREKMIYKREVETRLSVDVLVAGGGPAGVAAAVTAARQGRKVMIIEAMNCLGGIGTAGMLPVFMYFGDKTNFYSGGFGKEIHGRLSVNGGFLQDPMWGKECPVYHIEVLKRLYDDMAVKEKIMLSLVTQVIDVEKQSKTKVSHVICAAKSGIFAVEAKVFIDCTGDGDLAAWAGAPFEKGDKDGLMMPASLCSIWAGIDWKKFKSADQNPEQILIGMLEKHPEIFTQRDAHLPGVVETGPGVGGANVGHLFGIDGTDERSITPLLLLIRKILPEYEDFYRKHIKGFEKSMIISTAPLVGIRETRRITGDYVLNFDDYKRRADFEDGIGRGNFWIDIHPAGPSFDKYKEHVALRKTHYKDGESYGIPYRSLTPLGLDNVLVAGRCVSTDRAVQGSIRIMPTCYVTGQAAGMAAAIAAENEINTRQVPVKKLRKQLKEIGAFL